MQAFRYLVICIKIRNTLKLTNLLVTQKSFRMIATSYCTEHVK